MIRAFFFTMLLLSVCLIGGSEAAQHYYGRGRPIPLKTDPGKIRIKFDDQLTDSLRQELTGQISTLDAELTEPVSIDNFYAFTLPAGYNYDQVATDLRAMNQVRFVEPYYTSESGKPFIHGMSFAVGFNSGISREKIEQINAEHNTAIVRQSKYLKSIWVLNITEANSVGLLATANAYHELPETYFAHPQVVGGTYYAAYTVNDNYFEYQWNIARVIGELNVRSVWDFAGLSDSVIVAVIDDGVTTHDDLPAARILPGYDFFDEGDPDPSPGLYCNHGMACAGLIAASHSLSAKLGSAPDESAIISMNPHVMILPVKNSNEQGVMDIDPTTHADAISYAWHNGAAVLNNSWGSIFWLDVIAVAIDSAVVQGRNGLGSAVVFASGNGAIDYPDSILAYANHPATIAVGASGTSDSRLSFSMYGDELDLVAPSGWPCAWGTIWSLDQMDTLGRNPTVLHPPGCPLEDTITWGCPWITGNDDKIDCHFGGTSAAAPIVSGVASLILARDPQMPVMSDTSDYSIYGVLRGSAVPVGDPIPNIHTGYGRVDAYRAVLSIARGDANNDGHVSISDISYLNDYIFLGTGPPPWPDTLLGDVNCNGNVTISDVALLIDHLFITGDPLPLPCFEFND